MLFLLGGTIDIARSVRGNTIIQVGPTAKQVDLSEPFKRIDVIPELERRLNITISNFCRVYFLNKPREIRPISNSDPLNRSVKSPRNMRDAWH